LGSHLSIAKNLLERGCDVETTMEGDDTVLHIAAITGNEDMVDLILRFLPANAIDRKNEDGRTALHKAACFGKYKIVEKLLER